METGIHELTAGYALGALDPQERRAYEEHLAGCESCREELAAFAQVTEALAVAAAGPAPPLALRERILESVRAEPHVVIPLEPQRRRTTPVLAAVAAVAAVLAIGAGLWAASLAGELDDTRSALEHERDVASVLANPNARTIPLQEGDGRLVVAPDGRAALVLRDVAPAPSGKTYQMWIVAHGGTPRSAGLFPGGEPIDILRVDGTVQEGDVVAVTIEDAGGADAPSSEPVIGSMPA
jgi:anti-sigma-K factor RskA